jgi:hypothetical protein
MSQSRKVLTSEHELREKIRRFRDLAEETRAAVETVSVKHTQQLKADLRLLILDRAKVYESHADLLQTVLDRNYFRVWNDAVV